MPKSRLPRYHRLRSVGPDRQLRMRPWLVSILRCPETSQGVRSESDALRREDGTVIPVRNGIASLAWPRALAGDDARMNRLYERIAPFYALSERFLGRLITGVSIQRERARMISLVGLRPRMRLLEISPGPGVFQPLLREALGPAAEIAALDLSWNMLRQCQAQHGSLGVELVHGNAQYLPFADGSFDAVFHFGGVNLFNEPGRAVAEMVRIVRDRGVVCWGDEQISAGYRARHPFRSWVLTKLNPGYAREPPGIPSGLADVDTLEVCDGLGYLVRGRRCV